MSGSLSIINLSLQLTILYSKYKFDVIITCLNKIIKYLKTFIVCKTSDEIKGPFWLITRN